MKNFIITTLILTMFHCLNAQDSLIFHQAPKQWHGDTLYSKLIMIQVSSDTLIPIYSDSASRGTQINQELQDIFDFHCTRAGFSLDSIFFIREHDNDSVPENLQNIFNVIFPDFIEIQSLLDSLAENPLVFHVQPPFSLIPTGIPFYDAGASNNTQANWHIFKMQAPDAWVFLDNFTAKEPVGIIEFGRVYPNIPEFIDANNCKIYNYCPPISQYSYVSCGSNYYSQHATAVASTIASIPKLVGPASEGTISVGYKNTLVSSHWLNGAVNWLDDDFNCGTFARAVSEFSLSPPKILSLSFVFATGSFQQGISYIPRNQIQFQMDLLKELMKKNDGISKYARGTMVFAATANDAPWPKGAGYPFAEPGVIGIGGTSLDTQIGERALGSGTGAHYNYNVNDGYQPIEAYMEFTAPGYNIDIVEHEYVNNAWTQVVKKAEGTSLSSPMVATVAAAMFVVNSEFANDFYTDPILVLS
jgi:hypothetical protein